MKTAMKVLLLNNANERSDDGGIKLTAEKLPGSEHAPHRVKLIWEGAETDRIKVLRNDEEISELPNSGHYVDNTGESGSATYHYQICETDSGACSNKVTVSF